MKKPLFLYYTLKNLIMLDSNNLASNPLIPLNIEGFEWLLILIGTVLRSTSNYLFKVSILTAFKGHADRSL